MEQLVMVGRGGNLIVEKEGRQLDLAFGCWRGPLTRRRGSLRSAIYTVLASKDGLDEPVTFDEGEFRGNIVFEPRLPYRLAIDAGRPWNAANVEAKRSDLVRLANWLE